MSFNMPVTLAGDISEDSITRPDGYGSVELGSVLDLEQIQIKLNEDGDMSSLRCAHCGEELNEIDPTRTLENDTVECEDNDDGPHKAQTVPFTWAKNIAISFSEDNDEIELAIATGEPRGGWTFKLRRTPDGRVLMHLPHADMAAPHEPIRELHPGTFAIG